MEKRRRARINNCLNDLKTLILDAMKKDVSNNDFQRVTRNFVPNFSISIFNFFPLLETSHNKFQAMNRQSEPVQIHGNIFLSSSRNFFTPKTCANSS